MDTLKSFLSKLYKKSSKDRPVDVLIGHTHFVWQISLGFLGALLVVLVLCDWYIFLTNVQSSDQNINNSNEGTIRTIDKKLFLEVRDLLQKRKEAFDAAGENLPKRNPFLSLDDIKKQEEVKALEAAEAAKLEKAKKNK